MCITLNCGVRKIKHGMSKSLALRIEIIIFTVFLQPRSELCWMAVNGHVNGFSPLISVELNTPKTS